MTVKYVRDSLISVGYEYLDIFGEAGVRATGESVEEVFENAALGMYSMVTDAESVREKKKITVEVKGESPEGLLVGFLNELIFHLDANGFVGRRVKVLKLGGDSVRAEVSGEEFDLERHEPRLLLKAATYHDLKLENRGGKWTVEVIFDI